MRSLALFRVALGAAVLYDAVTRFGDLTAFLTDDGVLPRVFCFQDMHPLRLSVYMINGSAPFAAALLFLQAAAAAALLAGWRTRIAACVTWFLVISVQLRNPLVLQGGDILLRMLAFWAMFLPLGAAYSVDRALDTSGRAAPRVALSGGTIALLSQTLMVYLFSAALKTSPEWHRDGSAIYYALSLEQFSTPLGTWLLGFPDFLVLLTHFTWWIEAAGPLLLLAPFGGGAVRVLGVFVFAAFHLAMGACLRLGTFPLFDLVSLVPFLPSSFWDSLEAALRKGKEEVRIYFDADCGFCKKSVYLIREMFALAGAPVIPAQADPVTHELMLRHNSWIVEAGGRRYHKFDAFVELVRASPVFSFLAPVLRLKPVHAAGTSAYEWTASHRAKASLPLAWLRFTPAPAEPGTLAGGAAFLFLIYVFFWNWSTLPGGERFTLPRGYERPGKLLYLDQKWDMFSPYPLKMDGWYVIQAKLADGSRVDFFR
ncbi:MAG TPA: HTTM domain-containing protein, partial [Candidatus Eisenbacteria bacterium]|nr:HTTM domain-containing protein [Candidatus Eisenbacteria bacterium]